MKKYNKIILAFASLGTILFTLFALQSLNGGYGSSDATAFSILLSPAPAILLYFLIINKLNL